MSPSSTEKLPLPAFLKVLTSSGLAMDKAMAAASKIYKTCNTPQALAHLTDGKLMAMQVEDKEHRRLLLAAVKKAGYKGGPSVNDPVTAAASSAPKAKPAASSSKQTPPKKKRKRDYDVNEFLPAGPPDDAAAAACGSLAFDELLDEEALRTKSAVVNRAPVMTAWATVVAERMGFKREEALSIASVYTEMNATSKGVKLGIFEDGRGKGMEPAHASGQPYVDFMGRSLAWFVTEFNDVRSPVFSTTKYSQWRALLKGSPVPPSSAYSYISNAFRQTTGHVVGAMRLLADTYPPQELNRVAFGLYAEFRPSVDGWGKKGEVRCEAILGLRKNDGKTKHEGPAEAVVVRHIGEDEEREAKKKRAEMSVEEYEAALDAEGGYDSIVEEASAPVS